MDKKRTGESLKDLFKGDREINSKELKSQDAKTVKRQNVLVFKHRILGKRKGPRYEER